MSQSSKSHGREVPEDSPEKEAARLTICMPKRSLYRERVEERPHSLIAGFLHFTQPDSFWSEAGQLIIGARFTDYAYFRGDRSYSCTIHYHYVYVFNKHFRKII